MRILVITNLYPPLHYGGQELHCQDTVERLKSRGHEVFVLTSNHRASETKGEHGIYRRLRLYNPRAGLSSRLGATWLSKTNYETVLRTVREVRPEVIYFWNLVNISAASVLMALKRAGKPFGCQLGDYNLGNSLNFNAFARHPDPFEKTSLPKQLIKSTITHIFFRFLTKTLLSTTSQTIRQAYINYGYPAKNVRTIYLAVEQRSPSRASEEASTGTSRFLCAGQILEEKGVHLAIEAMAKLVYNYELSHVGLDIVGSGRPAYEERLRNMVRERNLHQNVLFRGWVGREELRQLYPRYLGLLFPTLRWEPFGMVVVEAMAAGLPVIASNRGGPTEVIMDGETGLLFAAGDAQDLAQAMKRLIDDAALRNSIRDRARQLVQREFSPEVVVQRVETYLREVQQSQPPTAP